MNVVNKILFFVILLVFIGVFDEITCKAMTSTTPRSRIGTKQTTTIRPITQHGKTHPTSKTSKTPTITREPFRIIGGFGEYPCHDDESRGVDGMCRPRSDFY